MKKEISENIIKKTKDFYDLISLDFDRTRSFNWQEISPFIDKFIKPGDKILDLGCGNGRLFDLLKEKNISYFGVDNSEQLIGIAEKKYGMAGAKFLAVDILKLPFAENSFDAVVSLAVFHHIPSEQNRQIFFQQIKKVLKNKGILILTSWNLWENPKAKWLLFKYTLLKLLGKSDLDFFDIFYPWKNSQGEIVGNRYLHFFSPKKLEKIATKNGFDIIESGILPRSQKYSNIYLIARKK
ncbi:MAG: class I SAM-dependent methyltransferase [bacterium]|nr:class I SAM-dependent methyltransferase [bacterium]